MAESLRDPQLTPEWLDNFKPWLIATVALITIAYGPQMIEQVANIQLNAPGFTP